MTHLFHLLRILAILLLAWSPTMLGLWVGHFICDYPLQGDFLARGKNRFNPLPGVPWLWCMMGHAAIHGGAVFVVTQSIPFALAEFVVHWIIDDLKCAGKIHFDLDQILHLSFKLLWTGLALGL